LIDFNELLVWGGHK